MDTRFWGPSGWQLIHLIAAEPAGHRSTAIRQWFTELEYVLPCKYCRASFHDYIRLQPLTKEILANTQAFGRWAYDIHNRVNEKLRGQGLLMTENPTWPEVDKRYSDLHRSLCKKSPLLGWDFMTSIAFTTPESDYRPTPMPDAPEPSKDWATLDEATRNRYNLLTRAERLKHLATWWRLIPSILPCATWRRVWSAAMRRFGQPPLERGRKSVLQWMWKIEESVCGQLQCPTPHSSLVALIDQMEAFESGCGKSKRGKTCRRLRHRRRQTQKQRG